MLTQKYLKSVMHYNLKTGGFTWLRSGGRTSIGSAAGSAHSNGYRVIVIDRNRYLSHRLAFMYVSGGFPNHCVDHINGIKNDNRWCNLRLATFAENSRNRNRDRTNKSGYKGVSWSEERKKWCAGIMDDNKKAINLGRFNNKKDAAIAYNEAAKNYHGEFAYLNIIKE